MNTDEYITFHFPHDPPDPSPRLPEQSGYSVWGPGQTIPRELIGLFIVAYSDRKIVAFLGPFVGMCAIESVIGRIFRALRGLGADAYEIARKE